MSGELVGSSSMSTVRLLLTFAIAFSLVSLPSVLSTNLHLPSIPVVRAQQEASYSSWYPAGAQEQTLSISQGDGASITQVNWLLTNQVDSEDWPLTATQQGASTVNCPGNSAVLCTAPVADQGYFEIQFNLANVLLGIPMQYGNNPAGVQLRQGIAHLINKVAFVAGNPACLGISCVPNDDPVPLCSVSSCSNGGLVNPNPCSWDALFPETSSTNCIVGAPGGTAYSCAYSTTCPTGTVTGTTQYAGQVAIGSPDFCAAAQHFVAAFKTQLGINVTLNGSCELIPPIGGWPAAVYAINQLGCNGQAPIATANLCFPVRTTEPRKSLGEGLSQEICALFSPAWTGGAGWTTLAGQPVSCDNSNTGTGNASCGGGPCSFVQEVEGVTSQWCAFNTSANGTPDNCWGLGTFGFGQVFPFDSTTYFEYNSLFATKTDYTCVSPDCSSKVPGSPCTSPTYTTAASDYMYICSPEYDSLSSQMENAPCLAAAGDPVLGQSTPPFADCPGTSQLSSISAGYQAVDLFGRNAFTIPVWDGNDRYARLSNWSQGGTTPGFSTAVGFGFSGLPNYFNWLNAYSASPALAGTLRQSFLTTVDSLNPFQATTLWDFYTLSSIYDGLFKPNPLCSIAATPGVMTCSQALQLVDWMTTSHSYLCYPGGLACTATTLGYGNSTYFANTTADLRLTLNRANHWHDGGPVTAWDVKYSLINLNATGSHQTTLFPFLFNSAQISLLNIAHINVLDEYTLDINLRSRGPFTDYYLGSITIMPGHIWSACGASTWNSGVTGKDIAGTSIVGAPEDVCVGIFGSPNIATVNGVRADSPTFDPVANNFLIGSGPYTCESIGGTGHPAVGTLGGGCSIDNTQAPAFGLGDFTLTRTGCTLTGTGTTCGIAGSSTDYFRSSGALANYVWSGDIGSGSADFSKVLTVNSCHSPTPSANCPHWAQGIGNPGGIGTNPVGLSQRLKVNLYRGISWIGFATPQSAGTQLILSCAAGYTLPGTTITPCTASNAGWTTAVLPGIGGYASTLYEVGSAVLGMSTSTLSPASVVGCATTYPNGGYDC